jgi:hypothetical protein
LLWMLLALVFLFVGLSVYWFIEYNWCLIV